jgi:hypothetical protein
MPTVDDIIGSVNIETSAADISLEALARKGEQTFERMRSAINKLEFASKGLDFDAFGNRLDRSFSSANNTLGETGKQFEIVKDAAGDLLSKAIETAGAFGKLAAGAAAAVSGLVALVVRAADADQKLQETASALGITSSQLEFFRGVAALAGIETEKFDRALFGLANQMEKTKLSQQNLSNQLKEAGVQRDEGLRKLNEERNRMADAARQVRELSDAERRYNQQRKAVQDQDHSTPALIAAQTKELDRLSEQYSRSTEMLRARQQREQDDLHIRQESLRIDQEQRIAEERLNREHARTQTELEKLNIQVLDASGNMRALDDVYAELADKIKDVKNPLEAQRIVFKATGDSSRALFSLLRQGSEAMKAQKAELDRIAPSLSEKQSASLEQARDSVNKLELTLSSVSGAWFSAFGPAVSTLMEGLSKWLATNREGILKLAEEWGTKLNVVASDFVALLNGGELTKGGFIQSLSQALTGLIAPLKVLGTIALSVFETIRVAAEGVAQVFNMIFGTQITGDALILFFLIGRFAGVFKLWEVAIGLVFKLMVGLFSALGPWGALFVILGGIIATVLINWLGGLNGIKAAWGLLVALFTGDPKQIKAAWDTLWQALPQTSKDNIQSIIDAWKFLTDLFSATFWKDLLVNAFNSLKESATNSLKAIGEWWDNLIEKVKTYLGLTSSGITKLAGEAGINDISLTPPTVAAGGGYIRGPGTGTSDSIPAWLSNGEFVIRAAAVRKAGLGLLHAINNGKIRGFNLGGLVDGFRPEMAMQPIRMATGGPVSQPQMHPVSLNIFGDKFDGLLAPEAVATKLVRFANEKQFKQSGRKPSWYGR